MTSTISSVHLLLLFSGQYLDCFWFQNLNVNSDNGYNLKTTTPCERTSNRVHWKLTWPGSAFSKCSAQKQVIKAQTSAKSAHNYSQRGSPNTSRTLRRLKPQHGPHMSKPAIWSKCHLATENGGTHVLPRSSARSTSTPTPLLLNFVIDMVEARITAQPHATTAFHPEKSSARFCNNSNKPVLSNPRKKPVDVLSPHQAARFLMESPPISTNHHNKSQVVEI